MNTNEEQKDAEVNVPTGELNGGVGGEASEQSDEVEGDADEVGEELEEGDEGETE